RSPLFQAVFVLQAPAVPFGMQELSLSRLESKNPGAKFDLTMFVTEGGGRLYGTLEFNTAIFDATTIRRMAGHFQVFLAALASTPDEVIWRLPILSCWEQAQLGAEWNPPARQYDINQTAACIHEMFEARVCLNPDSVAIAHCSDQLTYRELNRRSNQLANRLIALGAGPEIPVPLYMRRSLEMVIGLLGIL